MSKRLWVLILVPDTGWRCFPIYYCNVGLKRPKINDKRWPVFLKKLLNNKIHKTTIVNTFPVQIFVRFKRSSKHIFYSWPNLATTHEKAFPNLCIQWISASKIFLIKSKKFALPTPIGSSQYLSANKVWVFDIRQGTSQYLGRYNYATVILMGHQWLWWENCKRHLR